MPLFRRLSHAQATHGADKEIVIATLMLARR